MDTLWCEAMKDIEGLDLLEQAFQLGKLAAWQHNKINSTGGSSCIELNHIDDAHERAERIADIIGEPAREHFRAGFDSAIDFSLNADWRDEGGHDAE